MPGPSALPVKVSLWQRRIVHKLLRCRDTPQGMVYRMHIILLAAKGWSNARIAGYLHRSEPTVRLWRHRWVTACAQLGDIQRKKRHQKPWIQQVLSDAPRCGCPGKFTAEQMAQILAVACESPEASGRPVTHWTPLELADEAVQRGIVESISSRSVGRLLEEAALKPHRSRYGMHPNIEDEAVFTQEVQQVCGCYQQAPSLHAQGVHLLSTDEKTGIQALERLHPPLPMRPGKLECIEFESTRHGTQCLIPRFRTKRGRMSGVRNRMKP